MDRATKHLTRHCIEDNPRRELLSANGRVVAVELGARAGRHPPGFPGTDALPMNAVVSAENWLRSGQAAGEAPVVLGEGARLGVRRFLDAAIATGWEIHIVLLTSRRAARNRAERGSRQKDSWVKGATTRALRFHDYAAQRVGRGGGVTGAYVIAVDDLDYAVRAVQRLAQLDVPPPTNER